MGNLPTKGADGGRGRSLPWRSGKQRWGRCRARLLTGFEQQRLHASGRDPCFVANFLFLIFCFRSRLSGEHSRGRASVDRRRGGDSQAEYTFFRGSAPNQIIIAQCSNRTNDPSDGKKAVDASNKNWCGSAPHAYVVSGVPERQSKQLHPRACGRGSNHKARCYTVRVKRSARTVCSQRQVTTQRVSASQACV